MRHRLSNGFALSDVAIVLEVNNVTYRASPQTRSGKLATVSREVSATLNGDAYARLGNASVTDARQAYFSREKVVIRAA